VAETASVPCGDCHLCCRGDVIMLFPEHGDRIDDYQHIVIDVPEGRAAVVAEGDDGNCVYLGPTGCTIHDRAPFICKVFDCRRWFLSRTRTERRAMVKSGLADAAVFQAGRERLHTLAPLLHDESQRL
jgi:hypothetical protein